MKKAFIVWETDAWHSKANRVIISVCSTEKKAIKTISHQLKRKKVENLHEQLETLASIKQTQGLETNYLFEEYEVDKEYK